MLVCCHVVASNEVIMDEKDVLIVESVDELIACVCHAVSMAEMEWKVNRWWTP